MPGRDPPQAAVGTLHVGGREIPFMSPIPFLVLSRRGPSPDFQEMSYWSAGLWKQRGKAAASWAPENCMSKFCWGIPEESGCPFQPCGTRSWANASKQAFAHWRAACGMKKRHYWCLHWTASVHAQASTSLGFLGIKELLWASLWVWATVSSRELYFSFLVAVSVSFLIRLCYLMCRW